MLPAFLPPAGSLLPGLASLGNWIGSAPGMTAGALVVDPQPPLDPQPLQPLSQHESQQLLCIRALRRSIKLGLQHVSQHEPQEEPQLEPQLDVVAQLLQPLLQQLVVVAQLLQPLLHSQHLLRCMRALSLAKQPCLQQHSVSQPQLLPQPLLP